jgi:hypothetical protein
MKKYLCDKCGKELDVKYHDTICINGHDEYLDHDFCRDCYFLIKKIFIDWINKKDEMPKPRPWRERKVW